MQPCTPSLGYLLPVQTPINPNRHPIPRVRGILPSEPNAMPISTRHEAVIMRDAIRRLSASGRAEDCVRAEDLEEEPLELLPEDDVDNEVDRGVNGDQEVGDLDELADNDAVESLQDVVDQSEDVADEEDGYHAKKHGC